MGAIELLALLLALVVPRLCGAQCEAPLWGEHEELVLGADDLAASLVLVEAIAGDAADGLRHGCTQRSAFDYEPAAVLDDLSCVARVSGCTDLLALNYHPDANTEAGRCVFAEGVRPCAQLNCTGEFCWELLDAAFVACSAAGSACSEDCRSAAQNATAAGGHCGPAVLTAAAQNFEQLIHLLGEGIAAAGCGGVAAPLPTVVVTMTAAASMVGYVESSAFQVGKRPLKSPPRGDMPSNAPPLAAGSGGTPARS